LISCFFFPQRASASPWRSPRLKCFDWSSPTCVGELEVLGRLPRIPGLVLKASVLRREIRGPEGRAIMRIGQPTLNAKARRGSAEAHRGRHGWSSILTPLFAAPITSRVMSFVVIRHGRALPSLHRATSAILRASSARLRVHEVFPRVEPRLRP
jgi:hypothetical protein